MTWISIDVGGRSCALFECVIECCECVNNVLSRVLSTMASPPRRCSGGQELRIRKLKMHFDSMVVVWFIALIRMVACETSVVCWGRSDDGGDCSSVDFNVGGGVHAH